MIIMPTFPKNETEVVTLANSMVAGYTANPADFPSIDPLVELAALQAALTGFQGDKIAQEAAQSQSQIATVTKATALDALAELMKNDLKLSEVDTAADPTRLTEIGWGPRQQPQPVVAPGQSIDLHSRAEGQGTLWLEWDRPASGGPVRNYIIERRQQPEGGGEFGEWEIVGTSLNNDINLIAQPRGIQMEYWVKAVNTGGESMPSNTSAVVL
jgi:hypothetical protein